MEWSGVSVKEYSIITMSCTAHSNAPGVEDRLQYSKIEVGGGKYIVELHSTHCHNIDHLLSSVCPVLQSDQDKKIISGPATHYPHLLY